MQKIYSTVIAAAIVVGAGAVAANAAGESTNESKVITVSASTGTLTKSNPNSSFAYSWASNEVDPQVSITTGGNTNNMTFKGDYLGCYVGSRAEGKIYTISVTGDYYVSKIEMDMVNIDAGQSISVAIAGKTYNSTDEAQHIVATYRQGDNVTMTFDGANKGVRMENFQITCTPIAAGKVQGPVRPTEITDGQFAESTSWYTLQIGSSGLVIGDNADASHIALNRVITNLSESDQWCFEGNATDGYSIYNRAVGTTKMLAAPTEMKGTTGGESYPILKEPGDASYFYTWDILPSTSIQGTYYIAQHGNAANAINNRNGKLAFWTTGKDHGSSVAITIANQAYSLNVAAGDITDAGDGWISWQTNPRIELTGSAASTVGVSGQSLVLKGNNTYSYRISDVENCYVESIEGEVTPVSGNPVIAVEGANVTRASERFSVTGLTPENQPAISIKGEGEMAFSNLRMVIKRAPEKPSGQVIFRYDGTPGYTVVYRIPAIATVTTGTNAGRIVAINDYRYSGADIGSGRIDLYQTYSDDNGETWSTPDHMRNAAGAPVAQGDNGTGLTCGFGDPAMVSDRETGKLLVLACAGRVGFFGSRRDRPQPTVSWTSEDGGQTWSEYTDLTETIYSLFDGESKFGLIDGEFVASGRIMQSRFVKAGEYYRIYTAIASQNDGGTTRNWVLYSDDFGKSWAVLGGIDAAPVDGDGDESKVEELPDGSVVLAGRNRYGNRNFNIYTYSDPKTAAGSWAQKVTTQLELPSGINACDGEIMILPARNIETDAKCYLMLQSVPFGPGRSRVGIVWKALEKVEDFNTPSNLVKGWDGTFLVTKMGSAYSTMTWQNNNTLGFMFEEETFGKAYSEVYRNLTLQEITKNQYEYIADPNNEIADAISGKTSAVGSIGADKVTKSVKWFDTLGREVKSFRPGQLYIGSDGSKKVVK